MIFILTVMYLASASSYTGDFVNHFCESSFQLADPKTRYEDPQGYDKATYIRLGSQNPYSKDKDKVYYDGRFIKGADPKTFTVIPICSVFMGVDHKGFYCGTQFIGEYPDCSKFMD